MRSLIDRDIVQPVEGSYRLTGDIGELAVPDSLHALLAARLDALDPALRRLMADAAVLGTTFPAEALIAVSGQDGPSVRVALADLVRREVLSVSADPLSPEHGSYQFAQQMLRQVAYDTLSRRDRKIRHLTVAAHLRTTFASDGEEVADVIARHYLDALEAVPDDPDMAEIRNQAINALVRAAERAKRTGAPGRAAASYATAAELTVPGLAAEQWTAGMLWEWAAEAATDSDGMAAATEYAERAWRLLPAAWPAPGGSSYPGHRRADLASIGAPRRGTRPAHRGLGGAAGRPRHRHGVRAGPAGGARGYLPARPMPTGSVSRPSISARLWG